MSSASYDANGRDDRANASSTPAETQKELLDQVLRETVAASEDLDALDAGEREVLLAVAERYRGSSLSLDPIAVELVERLLRFRMGELSSSDKFWREMSTWIARTLMEDPESKTRLESLWNNLRGA